MNKPHAPPKLNTISLWDRADWILLTENTFFRTTLQYHPVDNIHTHLQTTITSRIQLPLVTSIAAETQTTTNSKAPNLNFWHINTATRSGSRIVAKRSLGPCLPDVLPRRRIVHRGCAPLAAASWATGRRYAAEATEANAKTISIDIYLGSEF
jgi:hypothetical protein